MEERGGLTGGGVGLGVAGVWGVCGVVGVCGVWGLWEDGLGNFAFGGLGVLEVGKDDGELVCRATAECLTGTAARVGEGGLVMEWMSLAGLGAVGGGTGLGETGGGIFLPSTGLPGVPGPGRGTLLLEAGCGGVCGPPCLFICATTGLGETGGFGFLTGPPSLPTGASWSILSL